MQSGSFTKKGSPEVQNLSSYHQVLPLFGSSSLELSGIGHAPVWLRLQGVPPTHQGPGHPSDLSSVASNPKKAAGRTWRHPHFSGGWRSVRSGKRCKQMQFRTFGKKRRMDILKEGDPPDLVQEEDMQTLLKRGLLFTDGQSLVFSLATTHLEVFFLLQIGPQRLPWLDLCSPLLVQCFGLCAPHGSLPPVDVWTERIGIRSAENIKRTEKREFPLPTNRGQVTL